MQPILKVKEIDALFQIDKKNLPVGKQRHSNDIEWSKCHLLDIIYQIYNCHSLRARDIVKVMNNMTR